MSEPVLRIKKAWKEVKFQASSAYDEDCEALVLEAVRHLVMAVAHRAQLESVATLEQELRDILGEVAP